MHAIVIKMPMDEKTRLPLLLKAQALDDLIASDKTEEIAEFDRIFTARSIGDAQHLARKIVKRRRKERKLQHS